MSLVLTYELSCLQCQIRRDRGPPCAELEAFSWKPSWQRHGGRTEQRGSTKEKLWPFAELGENRMRHHGHVLHRPLLLSTMTLVNIWFLVTLSSLLNDSHCLAIIITIINLISELCLERSSCPSLLQVSISSILQLHVGEEWYPLCCLVTNPGPSDYRSSMFFIAVATGMTYGVVF